MTSCDFSLLAEMSIQGSEMREHIPKIYKGGGAEGNHIQDILVY